VKLIKKIVKFLTLIEEYAITIFLLFMTFITFWGVVDRLILKGTLSWYEEISRYLGIWAALIGASLGVKKGVHIGVEAFVQFLPEKVQRYISLITTVFCIMFCGAIAYIGYGYCLKLMATAQLSPAMRIPIVWAYLSVPVGCTLMTLRYVMVLIEKIGNFKNAMNGRGEGA